MSKFHSFVECKNCLCVFSKSNVEIKRSLNHFCSKSCSASFNNSNRKLTQETKKKISVNMKKQIENGRPLPTGGGRKKIHRVCVPVTNILPCAKCYKFFEKTGNRKFCSTTCRKLFSTLNPSARKRKTPKSYHCAWCSIKFDSVYAKYCSEECRKQSQTILQRKHLEKNRHKYSRNKPSWMEKTFMEWLLNDIGMEESHRGFLREVRIKNPESGRNFYIDFVFPQSKKVIELDGNHHQQEDQKRRDTIKDNVLKLRGYEVLRITHDKFKKKVAFDIAKDFLNF